MEKVGAEHHSLQPIRAHMGLLRFDLEQITEQQVHGGKQGGIHQGVPQRSAMSMFRAYVPVV